MKLSIWLPLVLAACARGEPEVAPDAGSLADAGSVSGGDPCGPATCAGCCDPAGLCAAGDAEDACGTGGHACAACGAGDVCGGPGEGTCGPPAYYQLAIEGATMPPTDCAGSAWDDASAPDPYLRLNHPLGSYQTSIRDDTFEAWWNETVPDRFAPGVLLTSTIDMVVFDAEPGSDRAAATCKFAPGAGDLAGAELLLECPLGECADQHVAITLRFALIGP